VTPRSKRRKAKPSGSRVPLIAAVVISIVVLGLLALPLKRKNGVGRAVDIEVESGASDAVVIAKLEAAGIIDSPTVFSLLAKTRGGIGAKPGRHLLADDLSPTEVLRRLRRSVDAAKVHVTIPEGFHRFDIAKRLKDKRVCDEAAFIAATSDPLLLNELGLGASAEGWLFPATYDLPSNSDAVDVVRRMVSEAKGRIDKLIKQHGAPAMSVPEVITLASIVEKEAVADEERPIIASVFLNRIRDTKETGGRLEADPTAGYGCLVSQPLPPTCVTWLAAGSTKVSAAIQHDPLNRWSTYTHAGLPPTPIANPGEKSIAAVLAPAQTKYFYFVARGGGRHTFSETRAAHESAVHK
jgi:UPF0755 protein